MRTKPYTNIAILIICSLFFCTSYSQQQTTSTSKSDFWSKVRFGGNVGANFGRFTNLIIAPQAIYQLNPNVGIGAGLNYSYVERDFNDGADFKSNIAGFNLIGIANPIQFLQVSADFEYLNVNQNFDNRAFDREFWVPALFLGAGYRQGNFVVGARYDVLFNDNRSVYQQGIQPFVRVLF